MCSDPNLAQLNHMQVRHKCSQLSSSELLKAAQTDCGSLESSQVTHTAHRAQVLLFCPVGVNSADKIVLEHSESTHLNVVTLHTTSQLVTTEQLCLLTQRMKRYAYSIPCKLGCALQ